MPPSRSFAAGVVAALALTAPALARAATITVTTTADAVAVDGACSLREAITSANVNAAMAGPGECAAGDAAGTDRIVLPAGAYRRTIPGGGENANAFGDLDVVGPLEILGAGSTVTTIDAAGLDRVLDVRAAVAVRLADVTLTGGATAAGAGGPAVVAPVDSTDPVTGGTGGNAEDGAGIRSAGTLTIERSRVTGNVGGAGGRGGDGTGATSRTGGTPGRAGTGGAGGRGGAGGIIVTAGDLALVASVVSGNRGGAGGAGGTGQGGVGVGGVMPAAGGPGVGGHGGDGAAGGIAALGSVSVRDSAVLGNQSGAGGQGGDGRGGVAGGGGDGENGGDGTGAAGGAGGSGGGLLSSGLVTVERTTIASNTTGRGGTGGSGLGGFGASPDGSAAAGAGVGGAGGTGGAGGGVAAGTGTLTLVNVTLAGNSSAGGGGGGGGGFGNRNGPGSTGGTGGAGGPGGALAATGGTIAGSFLTIAGNGAGGGGQNGDSGDGGSAGGAGTAGSPGLGAGAAIASDAPVTVRASIFSNNACGGAVFVSDGGGNLAQSAAGCLGSPGDARLGALIANGGVPLTLALGTGSDAIDRVPASAGCPATDARGALRPVGAACDAGAFEVAPPLVTTGAATASGSTARIEGAVTTRGLATGARVQIGTTAAYGTDTPLVTIPGEAAPSAVAVSVGGLAPLMTYHYRVVATGPDGTVAGADRTFTVPRPRTTAIGAPKVRGFRVSPNRFAPVAKTGGRSLARAGRPARGAVITFRLSEKASVAIAVQRLLRGRLVAAGKSTRCRPASSGVVVPRSRRCTVIRSLGTVRLRGTSGVNRFVLTGRFGDRPMSPGSYRLVLVATDGDGHPSTPARTALTVLRAP